VASFAVICLHRVQNCSLIKTLGSIPLTDMKALMCGERSKRVTFNPNIKVHTIVAWNFAHRQARKDYWTTVAADRFRFKRRIQLCKNTLDEILSEEHRRKIYNDRFAN